MYNQGFDQRMQLPEMLVCRLDLLQFLLKPLQQNKVSETQESSLSKHHSYASLQQQQQLMCHYGLD